MAIGLTSSSLLLISFNTILFADFGPRPGSFAINLINSLVERVIKENIEEVILATSATVEGQTTAYYIQDSLKKTSAKVTKLAQGLPVGGEIESLDDGTLYSAFKNRTGIKTNSG